MPADLSPVADGLAELQADRLSRQKRRPPTPKRAQQSSETSSASGEERPSELPNVPSQNSIPSGAAPSEPPRRTHAPPTRSANAGADAGDDGPLTLVQVRVTESQLDYLDEIEAVAATRRFDVTDAAVMRFALRQLMAAQTPEQIVEHLGQPKVRGRRGRPRH